MGNKKLVFIGVGRLQSLGRVSKSAGRRNGWIFSEKKGKRGGGDFQRVNQKAAGGERKKEKSLSIRREPNALSRMRGKKRISEKVQKRISLRYELRKGGNEKEVSSLFGTA